MLQGAYAPHLGNWPFLLHFDIKEKVKHFACCIKGQHKQPHMSAINVFKELVPMLQHRNTNNFEKT